MGPTCTYRGIEIPCLIRWTENRSITSSILCDILKELDHKKIFPREEQGCKPFFFVDGHSSRFEVPFLQYINNKEHEWVVCIGVPYGTSLWQVGDAEEQNRLFKLNMSKCKQLLLRKRIDNNLSPFLEPTDIIPIINYAWERSFAEVPSNQEAIAERGWLPFNRNLLLHPEIKASMTKTESIEAVNRGLMPQVDFLGPQDSLIFSSQYLSNISLNVSQQLNYDNGVASFCVDSFLGQAKLMERKERLTEKEKNSETLKNRIGEGKRITAGTLFKADACRLGKTVLELQLECLQAKQKEERDKRTKRWNIYWNLKEAADDVLKQEPDPLKWKKTQAQKIVKSLKRKGDDALGKSLDALMQQYKNWKHRIPLQAEDFLLPSDVEVNPDSTTNNSNSSEIVCFDDQNIEKNTQITPVEI